MVGAEARLPATPIKPTSANDTTMPVSAANIEGRKPIPKVTSKPAIEMLNSEMLAVAQGQNNERGVPWRSPSGITLIPLTSIFRALAPAVVVEAGAVVMWCTIEPRNCTHQASQDT